MRRAVLAIAGLAVATSLLVATKTAPQAAPTAQYTPTGPPAGDGPAGPGATPTVGPSVASPEATRVAPTRTPTARPTRTSGGDQRTPTGRPSSSAPRSSTAPPPSSGGSYRVVGPVISNPYGNVQVRITMSGRTLLDVVALELPESSARSDQLSARAEPLLRAEALREQGADLDTVSGASYTSEGYRESLQAALDAAAAGERD